jgi:hypothetical protein
VFTAAAVEFFMVQPKRRRRKLLDRAHALAADPFVVPDFRSVDAAGREVSQIVSDDFIFDFWIDEATRQVIITAIDNVE